MSLPSLQQALAHHQAGDLDKAQGLYRAVLNGQPNDAMALHYLGVIAHQTGRRTEALDWMAQSIAAAPEVADFHCNLGVVWRDCGRLQEAADALCQAIRLRPKYPEALNNLGDVLRQQGRLAEAESILRQAIAISPTTAALNNLSLVLMDRKRPADAVGVLRDLLKIKPDDLSALKHLGNALRLSGRLEESEAVCRAAVRKAPQDADALFGLGNTLRALDQLPEAADVYRRAVVQRPDHSDLMVNLAGTLTDLAELDAAISAGCRAVELKPSSHDARYNLALALLMSGRMSEGWTMYESRWQCDGFLGTLLLLPQPLWDGTDPAGKTILLRAEQGCGDTIQFARYIPLLAQRGAKIILECQEELKPLLTGLEGAAQVVARGEEPGQFDCHLPLLSLPYFFGTTLETVPGGAPYLAADPRRVAAWAQRLAAYRGLKCGLVWAGNPVHRNDRNRSIPAASLEALSGIEGVQFFSLQKGASQGGAAPPKVAGMIDLAGDLNNFADTAGLLANLDLLISVDTSAAHLAGAMGRPVWTLLAQGPDWRWLLGTDRSPWYPTMKLWRQATRGNWGALVGELRTGLIEQVGVFPGGTESQPGRECLAANVV